MSSPQAAEPAPAADGPGKVDFLLATLWAALVAFALLITPISECGDSTFSTADFLNNLPATRVDPSWRALNQQLSDPVVEFVPWLEFSRSELAQGRFPLWNPHNGCGVPHWANFQSAVLSPFSLPYYVLPLKWALLASAFAKSFVAGFFLFLLLRALGLSHLACALGAVLFQASGHNALLIAYPHSGVIACAPAALFFVERMVAGGPVRKLSAGLVLSLVAMASAGHPETLFFGAAVVAAFASVRIVPRLRSNLACGGRLAGRIIGLCAAAALITMPLVLPFLEYVQHSPRAFGLESTGHVALGFADAERYLFPNFLGTPVLMKQFEAARPHPNYEIANLGYVGWLALVLALVSLPVALRSSRTLAFAVIALVWPFWAHDTFGLASGLASALGLGWIPSYVSQGAWALCIGVLAARGLHALFQGELPRWFVVTIVALGLAVLFLARSSALTTIEQLGSSHDGHTFGRGHVEMLTLSCCVAAATLLATLVKALSKVRGLVFPLLLVWAAPQNVNLLSAYQVAAPDALVYPKTEFLDAVAKAAAGERVLFLSQRGLPPHANQMYGLSFVSSYDALGIAEYNRLLGLLVEPRTSWQMPTKASRHALEVLGIRYVVVEEQMEAGGASWEGDLGELEEVARGNGQRLLRHASSRGRAWLAPRAEARPGPRKALFRTAEPDVDPYTSVIIGPEVPGGFEPRKAKLEPQGSVTIANETPQHLTLEVDTPVAQYLVLAHTRYPGWEATLDGETATILDANTAFMALDVPAGRHTIRFSYRPRSFRLGLLLAALGATLGILLSSFRRGNDG